MINFILANKDSGVLVYVLSLRKYAGLKKLEQSEIVVKNRELIIVLI